MSASTHPPQNPSQGDITGLLQAWREGDPQALEQLMPLVYDQLRVLARSHLQREADRHVLQTTVLVHEAYLRLVGVDLPWHGRAQFYAIAARLMRQVLVDLARERRAAKRGSGDAALSLDDVRVADATMITDHASRPDLLMVDEALTALAAVDQRKARVIELKFFGGLTIEETAAALAISHATVERDLKVAKAWLHRHLGGGASPGP